MEVGLGGTTGCPGLFDAVLLLKGVAVDDMEWFLLASFFSQGFKGVAIFCLATPTEFFRFWAHPPIN